MTRVADSVRRVRFVLLSGVLLACSNMLVAQTPSPALSSADGGTVVADQIIVQLQSAKSRAARAGDAQRLAARLGGRVNRRLARDQFAVIELAKGDSPTAAAARALTQPEVSAAAPNVIRRLVATPNDPLFSPNQWALNNTGQTVTFPDPSDPMTNISLTGLADADIDAPEAWDYTTGASSVVVAVIDSGFPTSNADLTPNLWINTDEIAGDSIDNDNNGFVDDRNGYDFIANSPVVTDTLGHGSFCSGIIGARGNNGASIAGINWQVSLMALKPFTNAGTATDGDLIESIDYAVANGARIINASWGDWLDSPPLRNAIRAAGDAGVLFVAAAGNDRTYLKDQPFYPACFDLPNVINVGASDIRDRWADFSNYDNTMVHIHAPGYWVFSSRPSTFEYGSGTSFATPQVAGVAALLLAQNPGLSMAQLRARVVSAFDARATLDGRGATNGRISAHRAVSQHLTDATPPATVASLQILETATNGFRLRFAAPGDDGNLGTTAFIEARVSTAPITASNFANAARIFHMPAPAAATTQQAFYATELLPNTTYYIRLRACDDAGNMSALSNEVSATTLNRTVYFEDNMESGAAKWTAVAPFALTTEFANSGSTAWTDSPGGDYVANRNINITTANPINLSTSTDPWLSFYHRYMFDTSFTSAGDNGEVQVTTDGVTYRTVAQFVNYHTPFRLQRVNLKDYAGQSSVRLRFRFRSDFSAKVADGWYIDDVEVYQPAALLPEPADFALESTTRFTTVNTAPAYTETAGGGAWFTSVSKAALAQTRTARSRYNVTTTLGSTARFTPMFAVDGNYQVFVAWGDNANANNIRHRIFHADGQTDMFVNQDSRFNANTWISLGTYRFVRGQSQTVGSVLVDDSTVSGVPNGSAEGRVYADAVRFVYQPTPANARVENWELYED